MVARDTLLDFGSSRLHTLGQKETEAISKTQCQAADPRVPVKLPIDLFFNVWRPRFLTDMKNEVRSLRIFRIHARFDSHVAGEKFACHTGDFVQHGYWNIGDAGLRDDAQFHARIRC